MTTNAPKIEVPRLNDIMFPPKPLRHILSPHRRGSRPEKVFVLPMNQVILETNKRDAAQYLVIDFEVILPSSFCASLETAR